MTTGRQTAGSRSVRDGASSRVAEEDGRRREQLHASASMERGMSRRRRTSAPPARALCAQHGATALGGCSSRHSRASQPARRGAAGGVAAERRGRWIEKGAIRRFQPCAFCVVDASPNRRIRIRIPHPPLPVCIVKTPLLALSIVAAIAHCKDATAVPELPACRPSAPRNAYTARARYVPSALLKSQPPSQPTTRARRLLRLLPT